MGKRSSRSEIFSRLHPKAQDFVLRELKRLNEKAARNRAANPAADVEPATCHEPMAKEEGPRLATPCRIHVHSVRHRLADSDGISAKAAIDGIVHAGVLPDDSPTFVKEVRYSQEKCGSHEQERTTITLESCETTPTQQAQMNLEVQGE